MKEKKTWRYTFRPVTIEGDIAFLPLTRGKTAVIDAADVPLVLGWNWCAKPGGNTFYALSNGLRKITLHQMILGRKAGYVIDHKDGDGLNCRRSNLRYATSRQNCLNQKARRDAVSSYKGVNIRPKTGRWRARIVIAGKRLSLGGFASEEAAAQAYDAAAKVHFGEFAVLNFPVAL